MPNTEPFQSARAPATSFRMQAANEKGGLAAVFDASRAELLRFLVARSGNAADAEDLLSELWLKVCSAHPGPISFAWRATFISIIFASVDAAKRATRNGARSTTAGQQLERKSPIHPEMRNNSWSSATRSGIWSMPSANFRQGHGGSF